MKTYSLLLCFILLVVVKFLFGEENISELNKLNSAVKRIETDIEKAQQIIKIKTDSLQYLNSKISLIENDSLLIKFNNNFQMSVRCNSYGYIKETNEIGDLSKLDSFEKNDTLSVFNYSKGYWYVKNNKNIYGFVSDYYITKTSELEKFKSLVDEKESKEQELATKKRIEKEVSQELLLEKEEKYKRNEEVIKKFGKKIGKDLIDGYFWIGMSDEMAKISLGTPKNTFRTVGEWGVHEQWVYNNTYLYFENGKLTSYQEF